VIGFGIRIGVFDGLLTAWDAFLGSLARFPRPRLFRRKSASGVELQATAPCLGRRRLAEEKQFEKRTARSLMGKHNGSRSIASAHG
jgi:hypothetical protein